MNLHQLITKIAAKENTEGRLVYGKYYSKLQKKYPELTLIKCDKSKIQQIKDQGYEEKLNDLIKEDYEDLFNQADIKYTDKQKIKIFEKELHLIGGSEEENSINDDIKHFVIRTLLKVPDYFFQLPASSTGKYHPDFTTTVNGLVKHVKAAVRVSLDLFNVDAFKFNQRQKGLVIASLILHDCAKNGFNNSQYTIPKHPTAITEFIKENIKLEDLPKDDLDIIVKNINSHMGKWNTSSSKSTKEILPKPKGKMEYFVHICDLIASRKYIAFDFDKDFEFNE